MAGGLLGLVRRIVAYGRDLVVSLQQQNSPTPSVEVARRFGTFSLALILARIARGLAIAAGLQERLERHPPSQQKPPAAAVRSPASPRTRPAGKRPPEPTRAEDDAALLRGLPSAQDIARLIRGRRPGAVIVEICRDLGIDASHPLWPEIQLAIIQYDGSLARLLRFWMARFPALLATAAGVAPAPSSPIGSGMLATGTGPP